MGQGWEINEFVKRLKENGLPDDPATKIALEVGRIVHWEKIRAIEDFKKRMIEMWKTNFYEL